MRDCFDNPEVSQPIVGLVGLDLQSLPSKYRKPMGLHRPWHDVESAIEHPTILLLQQYVNVVLANGFPAHLFHRLLIIGLRRERRLAGNGTAESHPKTDRNDQH
jgi:hypothetical protein